MRFPASSHDFRVGEWLVQPRLCRISGAGRTAHVRPKLIDLLDLLASNQGRVVGKEEILQQVWHGEFVVESVLARSIADLRRILDDRTDAPRIIETIPKRGYRLIASVEPIGPRRQDAASPSLAVLPFSNLGPDADEQYFCDGMTEELTNALAGVPGLRVTARTSAFAFRGRAIDLREVGRQLGVGHVVEGSVVVPMASFGQNGTDRPFKASLTGSVRWEWPGISPSDCTAVTTLTDSTGRATHFGRVAASWSHCPAEPAYVVDGRVTMTAANGDVLSGRYDYDPTSGSKSFPVILTGGTGRFADASGAVVLTFEVVPRLLPGCVPVPNPFPCYDFSVPWPWSATMTGTISY